MDSQDDVRYHNFEYPLKMIVAEELNDEFIEKIKKHKVVRARVYSESSYSEWETVGEIFIYDCELVARKNLKVVYKIKCLIDYNISCCVSVAYTSFKYLGIEVGDVKYPNKSDGWEF